MSNWTHKVAKFGRNGNDWYSFGTAFTGSLEECVAYAEHFASEQNTPIEGGRLSGFRVKVIARRGKTVEKIFKIDSEVPAGESGEMIFA